MDIVDNFKYYAGERTAKPGGVGSVGDVKTSVRLRRSCSDMPPVFEKRKSRGSNITDGNFQGMFRVSGPARVFDDAMYPHKRKIAHGFRWHDIRPTDRLVVPKFGGNPDYACRSKNVFKETDKGFSRMPGGFNPAPNTVSRGANMPRRYVIQGDQVSNPLVEPTNVTQAKLV